MGTDKKNYNILWEKGREGSRRAERVSETILALFLLNGILISFRDLAFAPYCLVAGRAVGSLILLIYQIASRNEKGSGRFKTVMYIAGIVCFVAGLMYLIPGFLYTVNCVLQMWNNRFGTEIRLFATGSRAGVGSLFLWVLLSGVLAMVTLGALKKKSICSLMLFLFVAAAFGYVLGQNSTWGMTVLLLGGFFGIFMFYSAPARETGVSGTGAIALILCLILVISLAAGGYNRSMDVERWKYQVRKKVENIRYGNDTLPEGDFRRAVSLLDGNKDTLEIRMEEPEELYLRGFTGADYTDTGWQTLSAEAYQGDYEGMLRWLEKQDFQPVSQYGSYEKLTDRSQGKSTKSQEIKIKNTGAYRKYVYLPSAVQSWDSFGSHVKKDWNVQSDAFLGAGSYSFQVGTGIPAADSMVPAAWVENASDEKENTYLAAESVYHSFADDSYLDVDDGLKTFITETFFSGDEKIQDMDFSQITSRIRQVLRLDTTYTKSPDTVPEGEDLIRWFLTDYKKGNAVYYATAAVMAYRTAGYPARYTEGYHLSADEADALNADGLKEITLTTRNSHAWVEVYVNGAGWMPVEVVPGMYVQTYTDQRVEGKTSYHIGGVADNSGFNTEDSTEETGTQGNSGSKYDKKHQNLPVSGTVIMILYLVFAVYLLLELQRMFRLQAAKKKSRSVDYYVSEIGRLLTMAGVKGDFTHPDELWQQIEEKFPGTEKDEYDRVLELIRKNRFGGIELKEHEYHTLKCFLERLTKILYGRQRFTGKFYFRYIRILK